MPVKILCRTCVEAKATRHPGTSPTLVLPPGLHAGSLLALLLIGWATGPTMSFYLPTHIPPYYGLTRCQRWGCGLWLLSCKSRQRRVLATWLSWLATRRPCSRAASSSGRMQSARVSSCFFPPLHSEGQRRCGAPIRTVVEMAVAMSRHANTPRRSMHLAMRYAVRLLNRFHRKLPDGAVGVPLWRFKGSKVPLNLDGYHPFGCVVETVLPKRQQRKFAEDQAVCVLRVR